MNAHKIINKIYNNYQNNQYEIKIINDYRQFIDIVCIPQNKITINNLTELGDLIYVSKCKIKSKIIPLMK
jgi:hypothetical protein